jgi:hypothetical protein
MTKYWISVRAVSGGAFCNDMIKVEGMTHPDHASGQRLARLRRDIEHVEH